MVELSPNVLTIVDGDVTIDADVVALKLFLSVETLKSEMAKGLVTSVAEAGVDEDEGRTRLTFRYRSHTWIVVVEPDGSLVESTIPVQRREPLTLLDLVKDAS